VSNAPAIVAAQGPIRRTPVALLELVRTHRRVAASAVLVAFLFLIAVLSPVISPHDPLAVNADNSYLPPLSPGHIFGTDELGRDLLSRVLWGSRVSLPVAFVAVAVGLVGGGLIGLVSGYSGGITDLLLMRVVDALLAFPGLILAIAIVAALGPGLRNAMIAIGIVAIPLYARLVRASVLQLKQMDFVLATRSIGASPLRIVLRHLIPNLLNPIIVQASLSAGFAILAEATLICRRVAIINHGRLLAIDSPSGLEQAMEQTNRVTLQVTAPAQALREELLSVDGVSGLEIHPFPGDHDVLSVECQVDARDGIEAAIARAVASRWDLHRLDRQRPTLENIFLRYVKEAPVRGETA